MKSIFRYFPVFRTSFPNLSLFTTTIRLISCFKCPCYQSSFTSVLHKPMRDKCASFAWRFSRNKDRKLHGQTPGGGVEPRRNGTLNSRRLLVHLTAKVPGSAVCRNTNRPCICSDSGQLITIGCKTPPNGKVSGKKSR